MYKHLRKVLRIPYHKIYVTFDEGDRYERFTKVKLKRRMQFPTWVHGIKQIDTNHRENYTKVYWRGKYVNA